MTIIIDPLGTPTFYPVRDGMSVLDLTGTGTTQVGATEVVPALSGVIVVKADSIEDNFAFVLSADFQIGDQVEMYDVSDGIGFQIFPQSGGNFLSRATDAAVSRGGNGTITMRKMSATEWFLVSNL
jgi:hypothetical protein